MVSETGITCLVQPRKSRCTRRSLLLHFSGYSNDLLVLNCLRMGERATIALFTSLIGVICQNIKQGQWSFDNKKAQINAFHCTYKEHMADIDDKADSACEVSCCFVFLERPHPQKTNTVYKLKLLGWDNVEHRLVSIPSRAEISPDHQCIIGTYSVEAYSYPGN